MLAEAGFGGFVLLRTSEMVVIPTVMRHMESRAPSDPCYLTFL